MDSSQGHLLSHLPAIYHASDDLREVLSIFEGFLLGPERKERKEGGHKPRQSSGKGRGLAEQIATISTLFDPEETPAEFVPWLAQWVALTHFSGLPPARQRRLLSTIVPLYGKRGTREYLEKILDFYKPEDAVIEIIETGTPGFEVGESPLGVETRLGGEAPFLFKVRIFSRRPPTDSAEEREFRTRMEKQLRRAIELAKPAHTCYELQWHFTEE